MCCRTDSCPQDQQSSGRLSCPPLDPPMAASQFRAPPLVAAPQTRAHRPSTAPCDHHACPSFMFHVGALSEPVLCSCPGVLDSSCDDKTGPHPTCPLPGTLTPRSLRWQLSVASASSRPTLPSAGTSSSSMVASAPPSFALLNVSRSVCGGVRTLSHA